VIPALVALAACSRAPQRAVERIAILPFDNLTGDAALDWVASAGPDILSEELAGGAHVLPLRATSVGTAALLGATQLLHCTFSQRGGSLHVEFALEDAERHRMVATGSVEGTVLFAVSTLARRLDAGARPFSTPNQDAVAAWGRGEFERAVTLDPDFGTAWASWIAQSAQSGKPEVAAVLAERALARASLRTPFSKAQIQLTSALLRKDETARIAALTDLARLAPNDTGIVLGLAEIEQRRRRYSAAAELYRRVLAMDSGNANALNGLGYAEGENGDLDAAKKTLEAYGQRPDQANNALDSLGEVHFMNGRFAEAEKYFAQVSAREPNFLNSAPLMKAAYAHWLGGDLAGADALMKKYLDLRAKQNDPLVVWREAVWQYATGRREQALATLGEAPQGQAANFERQRSVWRGEVRPPEDLNQLKTLFESTNPAADGLPRTLYAAALARAGKADEARALLKMWPLPESVGDPLLQSLLYPQFLELRKTLGVH
jgi:Flp pilus assembly protein TadD